MDLLFLRQIHWFFVVDLHISWGRERGHWGKRWGQRLDCHRPEVGEEETE